MCHFVRSCRRQTVGAVRIARPLMAGNTPLPPRSGERSYGNRSAFTLMELLLVLAVLVAVAAIVMPAAGRMLTRQRIRGGAETVRVEWAKARVRAMKSGRIHVFRYEVGGPSYRTEFWEADDTAVEAGDDSALAMGTSSQPNATLFDDLTQELPDGVRFFFGDTEQDVRSTAVVSQLDEAVDREIAWSPPILFYSDGTCSTAEVTLTNDKNDAITLNLRGLTGVVRVGDLIGLEDGDQPSSSVTTSNLQR